VVIVVVRRNWNIVTVGLMVLLLILHLKFGAEQIKDRFTLLRTNKVSP